MSAKRSTFVTGQQAKVHALFVEHRSMSAVARLLGLSQIRVREALVQYERNRLRDAGVVPPLLKEMLKGDVTTRFGVPREELYGRPAKHVTITRPETVIRSSGSSVPASPKIVRRLIVTAVEPGGNVHPGFWRNLKAYAAVRNAGLIVVRLGNTCKQSDLTADYQSHVSDLPVDFHGLVDVASDVVLPPRLSKPLERTRQRAHARWTIVPSSVVALETLARIRMKGLKAQITTGSMSNQMDEHLNRPSELGAVIAEVAPHGGVYCRHLLSPAGGDGSFQDLDIKVADGVCHRGRRVEALTFGDIHFAGMDPRVSSATWGLGQGTGTSLVDRLRPRFMVFHDVVDFDARSSHDARDHLKRFGQFALGGGEVEGELRAAARFLEKVRRSWSRSVVVGSNHDQALLRWLREADFRDDPTNAIFFLETALALHRRIAAGQSPADLFERTMRHLSHDGLRNVRFLRTGESLEIAGIEAAIHGHMAADGRLGDVRFFERMGILATVGHTHRPATRGGVYCAGVCATDLAYARGPLTSWAVGHVVTYANGTRQHLVYDGNDFHA
ncbi:hypothetical protein [Sphingomonas sp. PP-CC-3A-396]|uniref:hypothetical protein n=1 Tax=Sphingomonas sp. PP-CC-3A-396 TaxID=2135655 RepID=UPI00104A48EC|nr:hypothetical protein [Sphingomonas sp. PP-CC-3A-396]TCQ06563.1 hypothetical protein C8J40_105352 [Sphingomonas sp. PP-CC-3A-396]